MLQCLGRDKISARLSELDKIGYSVGPDTSKEFLMSDGKNLLVSSKGNIGMTTESNKNVIMSNNHPFLHKRYSHSCSNKKLYVQIMKFMYRVNMAFS